MVKVNSPTFPLNNGGQHPVMGYGTCVGMDSNYRVLTEDLPKMQKALAYAIDIGYRHIDTAHFYRVEPEVGAVINRKIKEGAVKREELFVTTKVWNHFHREAEVEVSLRGSLKSLGLDYVDMALMHWPMSISVDGVDEKIDYLETWRGFESCVAKGLTKGIGVSNFNVQQLTRLLQNCKIRPATLQIEVNLHYGQEELLAFCKAEKIVVVAYSPFGTMVPSHDRPNSPEPKLNNPTMVAIAKKYGKTVSQIALKHLVQRGIAIIPKSNTPSRVLENISIFDFTLAPEDVATIKKFDCGYRLENPGFWYKYTNFPFEKVGAVEKPVPEAFRKWSEDGKSNRK